MAEKSSGNKLNEKIAKISDKEFGQNGCDYITTTAATVGSWVAIKVTGDANAVFTTLTTSTGDDLDGITIKAGDVIYGPFTAITLTSGSVIAYRKHIGI
jgi:hypothetical protein